MHIYTKLAVEICKEFEQFYPKVYICPARKPTIGWGHVILPGENLTEISIDKGIELLVNDMSKAKDAINQLVTVPLSQMQFDALVSFVFNVGRGNFATSTMLKLINAGKYLEASKQFERWVNGGGKRLPGLVTRRQFERVIFLAGC